MKKRPTVSDGTKTDYSKDPRGNRALLFMISTKAKSTEQIVEELLEASENAGIEVKDG